MARVEQTCYGSPGSGATVSPSNREIAANWSYDFRPPPEPKPEPRIAGPWRLAKKTKSESAAGKARCKKPEQTLEPAFGIINPPR